MIIALYFWILLQYPVQLFIFKLKQALKLIFKAGYKNEV